MNHIINMIFFLSTNFWDPGKELHNEHDISLVHRLLTPWERIIQSSWHFLCPSTWHPEKESHNHNDISCPHNHHVVALVHKLLSPWERITQSSWQNENDISLEEQKFEDLRKNHKINTIQPQNEHDTPLAHLFQKGFETLVKEVTPKTFCLLIFFTDSLRLWKCSTSKWKKAWTQGQHLLWHGSQHHQMKTQPNRNYFVCFVCLLWLSVIPSLACIHTYTDLKRQTSLPLYSKLQPYSHSQSPVTGHPRNYKY